MSQSANIRADLRAVTNAFENSMAKIFWQMATPALLEFHRRFDVGHEIVLPERARKDHT